MTDAADSLLNDIFKYKSVDVSDDRIAAAQELVDLGVITFNAAEDGVYRVELNTAEMITIDLKETPVQEAQREGRCEGILKLQQYFIATLVDDFGPGPYSHEDIIKHIITCANVLTF